MGSSKTVESFKLLRIDVELASVFGDEECIAEPWLLYFIFI